EPDPAVAVFGPNYTAGPRRKRRQNPATLLLNEGREFQTQPRAISDARRRVMVPDDLNVFAFLCFAIPMQENEFRRLPAGNELDDSHYRSIVVSSERDHGAVLPQSCQEGYRCVRGSFIVN